jgi:hypothetical protein
LSRVFPYLIICLLLSAGYVIYSDAIFVFTAEKTHGRILDPGVAADCSPSTDRIQCDWRYYYPVSFPDISGNTHIVSVAGITQGKLEYYDGVELELLYDPHDIGSITENRFLNKWWGSLVVTLIAGLLTVVYLRIRIGNSGAQIYRINKSLVLLLSILWLGIGIYELATSPQFMDTFRPNQITKVKFVSISPALLDVQVTYYYNGRYGNQTGISSQPGNGDHESLWITKTHPLQVGEHTVHFQHQLDPVNDQPICTKFTKVAMYKYGGTNFLERQAEHRHCWEYAIDKSIGTDCTIKGDRPGVEIE